METDIIVVGAGAAGLMAARELSKADKKVIILEARDRIGGRIYPLAKEEWDYEAQGGAEFVHGAAPVTRALLKEIGLTTDTNADGEWWTNFDNKLAPLVGPGPTPYDPLLKTKLQELTEDIPIEEFFNRYFNDKEYDALRKTVFRRIEGYFAGDPTKTSVFAFREEVNSSGGEVGNSNSNITEGYGAMLRYLREACVAQGVEILLEKEVARIDWGGDAVAVACKDGSHYSSSKILVTVPLPVLADLIFNPALPKKVQAASQIGFGSATKVLLRFKTKWWEHAADQNFEKLHFMISYEPIQAWWTQYPDSSTVLTGWVAGPRAQALSNHSDEEVIRIALTSLSEIFKVSTDQLKAEVVASKIVSWSKDKYAKGAYSYPTPQSHSAIEELLKPEGNKVFFAGEAVEPTGSASTVEGALKSGLRAAKEILNTL